MSGPDSFDTAGFDRYLGDLIHLGGPGTNTDAAFRGEIASFLNTCIDYTPAATPAKIQARANYRFNEKYALRGAGDLKVTMNDGTRGGAAVAENVWLRSGGKFYIMRGPGRWPAQGKEKTSRFSPDGAHWPERIWAQYQSLIDQTPEELARIKAQWIAQAKRSRGLAKASWGQVARSLGLAGVFEALPLYAQRAVGSDGKPYVNGTGERTSDASSIGYTLTNAMPALALGGGLDGEGIANRALVARETALETSLTKGVFDDIEQLARRYPGLLAA